MPRGKWKQKEKKNSPPQFIFTPQEVTPPAFAVSGPYLSGRRGWQSHAPPQTQNGAGFGRGLRGFGWRAVAVATVEISGVTKPHATHTNQE